MITENIAEVRSRIERKCSEVKRDLSGITLIAVSKNFGVAEVNEAFKEGIVNFGENKAQELDKKFAEIGSKVTWHFIGHLQRNKARFVVNSAEYIHSVDSLDLANEINKRAGKIGKVQKILLQVKTSDEESKSGITDESEVKDLISYCTEFENIKPVGLMTIAPLTDDEIIIRKSFSYLRKLRDKLNIEWPDIKELSMGMTSDFEIAIEEGATMLRIGSAIFGERDYSKDWKEI